MNEAPQGQVSSATEGDAGAPTISVIMPNYNGSNFLARSIESVLRQSFGNLELLIVDDGSRDNSTEIVEAFKDGRIRMIKQDHEGVCAARNRGIREARGSYIAFLDSDDTWNSVCLERLHDALLHEPNAAIAYCGWQNVGLTGGRGNPFIPPDYETPHKLELWLQNCRWPIHAALTVAEAIKAAEGFNPRFPTSEDFLLWLQIVSDHKVVRVPEVLAFYFHHEGPRATSNPVRMAINHLGAQEHYLRHHPRVRNQLGRRKIAELTVGEMLKRGYQCYWNGDLDSARKIFRQVMKRGYGTPRDWKRMLPALLPLRLHDRLVPKKLTRSTESPDGRA